MFVPSLKDKISEHLARLLVCDADTAFCQFASGHLKTLDDVYDAIKSSLCSTLGEPIERLPTELLQSLAQSVEDLGSFTILPILTLLSPYCVKLDFSHLRCPPKVVWFCMRRMGAGVRKIRFPRNSEDDELLFALAESPAAATLRKIDFFYSQGTISDASSEAWKLFPSLESIFTDSDYITAKTLEAVLALPKLRKLGFQSHKLGGIEVVEKAIERNLQLEHFVIDLDRSDLDSQVRAVIELFRAHPDFTANLRYLQLAKYSSLDSNMIEEIKRDLFETCPKLECIPYIFPNDSIRLSDARPFLRFLWADYSNKVVTQHDIDLLASTSPELDSIRLENVDFRATDLRGLTKLKRLDLEIVGSIPAGTMFPRDLTELSLSSNDGFLSHSDFKAFMMQIIDSHPKLEKLYIRIPHVIDKETYLHLLASLKDLVSLCLSGPPPNDEDNDDRIELVECNHPSLETKPRIEEMKIGTVLGNLPNLRDMSISRIDNHTKFDASRSFLLSGLRSVDLPIEQWDIGFARGLKRLERVALAGKPQHDLPISLLELSSLQSVFLERCYVTEAFCRDLVSRLTRLQCLRINQERDETPENGTDSLIRSLDWINQSGLLHRLEIENLGAFLLPGELSPINFSGQHLQFLTEVYIVFSDSNVAPASMNLESLPNLRNFEMLDARGQDSVSTAMDVVVSRCPSLHELSFSSIGIRGFVLADVPRLDRLQLNYTCKIFCSSEELPERFLFSDLPNLYTLRFKPSAWNDAEVELLKGVEALLRAHAPNLGPVEYD